MNGPYANALRLQALRAAGAKVSSLLGIVTSYDPAKYAAKVSLQPEGIPTGFLPIAALLAGNGWGIYAPPPINAQVVVQLINGDLNAGFIECQFFNSAVVPVSVPAGEILLQHQTGSLLQFNNDGTVALKSIGNLSVTAPTVAVTGNLTVSGTIVAAHEITGNGVALSTHVHSGVTTGTGDSGPPT